MSAVFAFNEFELDELRFELRRSGRRVRVQPKVLRLLFYLVVNRQRSVSGDELLEALWPGEVVTAASVRRAVAGARRSLGESGSGQSTIRTVRDHGYQFLLEVRERRLPERESLDHAALASSGVSTPEQSVQGADGYIGRERVLALFENTLHEVQGGRGRTLLIAGEAGIGKTRTLRELARRSRAMNATVLWGRCTILDGAPVLWPVLQLLREAAEKMSHAVLRTLMGTGAADVAEAIPELGQWLPDLPAPPRIDALSARFRFFDSMSVFLKRAAEAQPLLLLFDDLQYADPMTLSLIAFLAQQVDGSRVLLAGSVRSAAECDPQRLESLRAISSEPTSRRIELTGFTHQEIARYVAQWTGTEPPESAAFELQGQTSGNPLLLQHVLQSLTPPFPKDGEWSTRLAQTAQTGGVRAAVARHLAGLPSPCRLTLQAAAVLGREFSVALLARVEESSLEQVLERISAAIDCGIVQRVSDVIGQHRFTHALIRDSLYEDLPASERARLHGRAAQALEVGSAPAQGVVLSQIAEHFARAAPGHDGGRALEYAVRAARSAMERLAHEEAVQHLENAFQLANLDAGSTEQRMWLLLDKADALLCQADTLAARESLLDAAAIADQLGAIEGTVRAALLLGRLPQLGAVDAAHVQLLERALTTLPEADARRPCLQALLAKALNWSREHGPRAERGLAALAVARNVRDAAPRTEALLNCLHALADPDCLPQRLEVTAELERIGHEQSDYRALSAATAARIWSCVEFGDMVGAASSTSALETLADQLRDPFARWHARVFRAMCALIAGRLGDATRFAREARELGTRLREPNAQRVYCTQFGAVLRLEGRLEEAAALVRDVVLRHPGIAGWQAVLAGIEVDMGRTAQAGRVLGRLLDRNLESLRSDPFTLGALAPAADLCAQVGDVEQIKCFYDALLPYADRHAVISTGTNTHGPLARHLGRLALRKHDENAAARHFRAAIAASEAMCSPIFTSISCLAYGRLLLAMGKPGAREHARPFVMRAFHLAHGAGLSSIASQCTSFAKRAQLTLRPAEPRSA